MPAQKESPRRAAGANLGVGHGTGLRASMRIVAQAESAVKTNSTAKRILAPMLHTARRNGWTKITGCVVTLWAAWVSEGNRD